MKRWSVFIFLCLVGVCCRLNALNMVIQKKYPRTLLTDDYGILNQFDLQIYNSSVQVGVNAWQCFKTSAVSVKYSDLDYDSDLKLRFAMLKIIIHLNGNIIHEYELARGFFFPKQPNGCFFLCY